jgi:putative phosphoesterase
MCGRHWTPLESAGLSDSVILTSRREFAQPLVMGVLSDTHVRRHGQRRLPGEVIDLFRRFGCGLIVHLGDVNTASVLESLATIAPVLAVQGNNDHDLVAVLPMEIRFTVGSFRVTMVHGHGGRSARSEAQRIAGDSDLVLYGHSHIPMIEQIEDTAYFNPGSPTDRRWQDHFGVGVVTFADGRCSPELILFNDPRELENVNP